MVGPMDPGPRALYGRWVAANAVGEMAGLGATFALTALLFRGMGQGGRALPALLGFGLAVAAGAVEATVVGALQWWAMRPSLPAVRRRAWLLATLAGALAAYVLGYLPSTLMRLGTGAGTAPPAPPSRWVVMLLAALLGAVGGAVLSFAQWLVLRRHHVGAGWWVPANALAWTLGMPVIFWGIGVARAAPGPAAGAALLAVVLLAAGGLVGAVHGVVLVRLAAAARHRAEGPRESLAFGPALR